MDTQNDSLTSRPTEAHTLHFNFSKTAANANDVYTFNHSMVSVPLKPHDATTLAAARMHMPLLKAVADNNLTHYVDVQLPSDCLVMTYVTVGRHIDGQHVNHPVHFGLHIPREGRAAARNLLRARNKNEAPKVHPKLRRLGITREQLMDLEEGAVNPEFPDQIESLQDAIDASVALLFQHGSLINLSAKHGGAIPAIIEAHILEAVSSTYELPLTIFSLGDQWMETKVVDIPDSDKKTTSTIPNEEVRKAMTGALQLAIVAVQNDPALKGEQWNINYGTTTASYNGKSEGVPGEQVATLLHREAPGADAADKWTTTNRSIMNGLSVEANSVRYTPPATKPTWVATGVWSANDKLPDVPLRPTTVTALMAGNLCIQVTTPGHPGGYLRGQLVKTTTDPVTGITKFTATLNGASVVPAVAATGEGTATFDLNIGGTGLSYSVSVTGVTDTNIGAALYIGMPGASAGEPLHRVALTNTTGYGTLTLDVTNKWLRHLSACVEYLDVAGNTLTPRGWSSRIPGFLQAVFEPNSNKPFVALLPPVSTVFGIPISPDPVTISLPIWEEVHTVRILMGGLGRGDYDGDVCPVGITVTALAELALPVFILFLGTSISNSKAVQSLLADKEVLFAICAAGAFLVAGPTAAYIALAQNPAKAAEGLAVKFGPMLLSPATSLGKWVAEMVVKGAAERAAPFIDIALFVINAAVTAAQLSQTIIEVLSSPFVYETRVSRSMGLKITLIPSKKYNKFPDHHAYMQIYVVYDVGSTQPVYTRALPVTPLSKPITIEFDSVPAGGNLRVFALFFANNGWQSGQGITGWLRATANNGNILEIKGLEVKINEIPLSEKSVYMHQSKIGMVNGQINWIAQVGTPPTATQTTPPPFAATGKEIMRLGSITFAQAPEMVGYHWQAKGLNVPPNTESMPRSNDALWTMQNLSVLEEPKVGYAVPKVGFTRQPGIAYNMASEDNSKTNFFIDSSNDAFDELNNPKGGYHVRSLNLHHDGPAPVFSTTSNISYGRFPEALDKYVYHPQGFIIGISFTSNKLYRLELPAAPTDDLHAQHAVMSSGTGNREGLMAGPAGIAVALDGRVLVVESINARVQAFDIFGNPVQYFGTGDNKTSVLALKHRANSKYLDISVESRGYIYVLSYTGDGSLPSMYQVDIYMPNGEFLVTTPNVAAAKMMVDILRNIFTLNYETFLDATGRPQPSISQWLPPVPDPVFLTEAVEAGEANEELATAMDRKVFLGKWSINANGSRWAFASLNGLSDFINVYRVNNSTFNNIVVQIGAPPRDVTAGTDGLYYGAPVDSSPACILINGVEKEIGKAFILSAFDNNNNPPFFAPMPGSGPAPYQNAPFGWFNIGQGQVRFGWSIRNPQPPSSTYHVQVHAPGSKYIRDFLVGAAPNGTDYSFIDLSNDNFAGITLRAAKFIGAKLTRTNFNGCMLEGADFTGWVNAAGVTYKIDGASFRGAKLAGARFVKVDLTGVDFSGADLKGTVFTDAILTNCIFGHDGTQSCDLSYTDLSVCKSVAGAKFTRAILFKTKFSSLPNFTATDFTGAAMAGTLFDRTNLTNAIFSPDPTFSDTQDHRTDFSYATVNFSALNLKWKYMDLSHATINNLSKNLSKLVALSTIMKGLVFTETNFKDAVFTNAVLHGCSFAGCGLAATNFNGAQLQGDAEHGAVNFSAADLMNAKFVGANLTGVNFTSAFFWGNGATVSNAVIERTIFDHAYLVGIDFSGVFQKQCQGANFDFACLINAVFLGTDAGKYKTQATTFSRACLHGADFTGASLDGANLVYAGVAQTPGTIKVKMKMGWPMVETVIPAFPFTKPTKGIESATNNNTICPSTDKGPCTVAKQTSSRAPTEWPVITRREDEVS